MASHSSPLSAASPAYLEALLESYRSDPESIDYSWRCVFQMLDALESGWSDRLAPNIDALRIAYRQRGHLVADLNPLAPACGSDDADAMIDAELGASTFPGDVAGPTSVPEPMSAAALARHLRSRYCATLTVESAHIDDVRIRRWLEGTVEGHEPSADSEGRLRALDLLCAADEFEGLLALRLPTKKRFGIEGATSLVPLLDRVLQRAAAEGVDRVLIGTMHRGRLNLLANVLGKPPEDLFAEFKGRHPFPDDPGFAADVAYHLG
ncbi:MAG: hypothetical protein IH616_23200, partial [Gemmatimonadales bacterium]|nr:hypothetical protein [Gemmatimonadales bacterium]